MCLGIPGKIVEIYREDTLLMGIVDYGGVKNKVCLEYLPDAKKEDYVIVHVGFGLSLIDENEANETLEYLKTIENSEE